MALDVTDPTRPVTLGAQKTDEWAMHVDADDDGAYVADWGRLTQLTLDRSLPAPEADFSRQEIFYASGNDEIDLGLRNRGSVPLQIVGMGVDDPRFRVETDRRDVASGEKAHLRLLFMDDGEPIDAELCVATNDPDEPVKRIPIQSNPPGAEVQIGSVAPDFVLRDVDGNLHKLSEQRGHPVVLVYFATW